MMTRRGDPLGRPYKETRPFFLYASNSAAFLPML